MNDRLNGPTPRDPALDTVSPWRAPDDQGWTFGPDGREWHEPAFPPLWFGPGPIDQAELDPFHRPASHGAAAQHSQAPGSDRPHPEAPGKAGPRRTHALLLTAALAASALLGAAAALQLAAPDLTECRL